MKTAVEIESSGKPPTTPHIEPAPEQTKSAAPPALAPPPDIPPHAEQPVIPTGPASPAVATQTAIAVQALQQSKEDLQIAANMLTNFNYIGGTPVTGPAAKTNNIYGQFSVWTGAKFSNPYMIKGNALSAAGTSSDGYIELNLNSRYVLRQGDDASDIKWWWTDQSQAGPADEEEFGHVHPVNPLIHFPDIDARFGYLFRGSSAPTNFNSSTVVGSADFYADTSIGVPLVRYASDDNYWKHQVSLELNGGFASAKDHLDLHPNAFVGLGWQASFFMNSTNQGYWIGRAGYAWVDQPILMHGTNTVELDQLQQPKFAMKGAPSIGIIVSFPLTSALSFQTSANAYFLDHPPASWNASIGLSVDISKVFGALK